MILKNGSKGREVGIWQVFLVAQGFNLTVDDDFGSGTEKATRAFQTKQAIDVDGKVGPGTIAAATALGFQGFESDDADIGEKTVSSTPASHLSLFTGSTMVDQINAAKLARVSPALQDRGAQFIAAAAADGVILQIVQGLRTFAEQDALYAKGRTKPGPKVTNAKGGQSNHNYGLALDLAPVVGGNVSWDEKLYKPYGGWAEKAGLSWGGNWKSFKDLPHVEYLKGHSLGQVQELYRQGGLSRVWAEID